MGNISDKNSIFLFIFFWASCLDATQFVYVAEIFPTHVRSQGTAVGMAGLFCGTVVVLVAGPIALNAISWKFYFVLIIPPAIEFLCVYFFFPETKVSGTRNFVGRANIDC